MPKRRQPGLLVLCANWKKRQRGERKTKKRSCRLSQQEEDSGIRAIFIFIRQFEREDQVGFDTTFFDELRLLTAANIAPVSPQSYRPTVSELYQENRVSRQFLIETMDLIKTITTRNAAYRFDPDFRVYPQHITNWSRKRAFRKQLNVGFYAGDNPDEDSVRIGLGFRLNYNEKSQGVDEYLEFLAKIQSDPIHFDNLLSGLGNYAEGLTPQGNPAAPLSAQILVDSSDYNDDWRFYGKVLYCSTGASILASLNLFVDEIISVFDQITRAGYY